MDDVENVMLVWADFAQGKEFKDDEHKSMVTEGIELLLRRHIKREKAEAVASLLELPEDTAKYYSEFIEHLLNKAERVNADSDAAQVLMDVYNQLADIQKKLAVLISNGK